jgi:hypothetical protein
LGSVSPYPALDAETWRRLLAHAALLRAVSARLTELDLALGRPPFQSAVAALSTAALASCGANDDDQAVRQATERWREDLGRLAALVDGNERELLDELGRRAADATAEDPFETLFAGVATKAKAVYGACWQAAELSVAWLAAPPRRYAPDRFAVTATTVPGATPVVEVLIYADGFGPAAYAAIPSLLVHECVCHVPARQGGAVSNASPCAEGFMDWAARFFFDRWMLELDAALAPAARHFARGLENAVTLAETVEGAVRIRGRNAADVIGARLVAKSGLTPAEAEAWTARLAVELNCTEAPLARKDRFVVALNGEWPPTLLNHLADVRTGRAQAESLF